MVHHLFRSCTVQQQSSLISLSKVNYIDQIMLLNLKPYSCTVHSPPNLFSFLPRHLFSFLFPISKFYFLNRGGCRFELYFSPYINLCFCIVCFVFYFSRRKKMAWKIRSIVNWVRGERRMQSFSFCFEKVDEKRKKIHQGRYTIRYKTSKIHGIEMKHQLHRNT